MLIRDFGYGFFPGGDPRKFDPDGDSSDVERENHRKACAAWDRGEADSRPDCSHGAEIIITSCQFGLGSYEYSYEAPMGEWLEWKRAQRPKRFAKPPRRWPHRGLLFEGAF